MTQCARTRENRGGVGGVKDERGQRKQRSSTSSAQERSAPCATNLEDANPGFDVQPDLHPLTSHRLAFVPCRVRTSLLTVQNIMKYCSTVAAMNRQYTSE